MAQPVAQGQYKWVAAAGTTVITDRAASLINVLIPGTYVGSVEWYDTAAAAGTAAGNLIYQVALPGLNQNQSIAVGARTKNGLVCVATGTPTVGFIWD